MWSPTRAPVQPRQGWTGPTRQTPAAPPPGWVQLVARGGTSVGVGGDLAALLAHLAATDRHVGRDWAALSGVGGTGAAASVDTAAPLVHLLGGDAGLGRDDASWLLTLFGSFVDQHAGRDGAALAARVAGGSTSIGRDLAGLLAQLRGGERGLGSTSAAARYAPHADETTLFDLAGTSTYPIPSWCTHLDFVLIGGGASGQTGNGANTLRGSGGQAATWGGVTFSRDLLGWGEETLTVTVGAGGPQPANADHAGPNPGSPTTIAFSGGVLLGDSGATGTVSGQNGASPGNYVYRGVAYPGGIGGTGNGGNSTTAPGAGGAGGNGGVFGRRTVGGYGSRGRVWIIARQEG